MGASSSFCPSFFRTVSSTRPKSGLKPDTTSDGPAVAIGAPTPTSAGPAVADGASTPNSNGPAAVNDASTLNESSVSAGALLPSGAADASRENLSDDSLHCKAGCSSSQSSFSESQSAVAMVESS